MSEPLPTASLGRCGGFPDVESRAALMNRAYTDDRWSPAVNHGVRRFREILNRHGLGKK